MRALVAGATGMVGRQLVAQLLERPEFSEVRIFVRRRMGIYHQKLSEYLVDFDKPESFEQLVKGDVLFLCMGTTLATAGSKINQWKVDYVYQMNMAKAAEGNGVKGCVVISSAGAKSTSSNFYLGLKGKLDDRIALCDFSYYCILRPGQLYGNRENSRPGESIALAVMFFLNKIGLFKRYRPIHAKEVSAAMISFALQNKTRIATLDDLFNTD